MVHCFTQRATGCGQRASWEIRIVRKHKQLLGGGQDSRATIINWPVYLGKKVKTKVTEVRPYLRQPHTRLFCSYKSQARNFRGEKKGGGGWDKRAPKINLIGTGGKP